MRLIFISLIAFTFVGGAFLPLAAFAVEYEGDLGSGKYEGLVPCGREDADNDNVVDNPCGFSHIIELAKRIITAWILAGVIVAALGFSYAGFLYITAMGSQEKISHAHSIFVKTFFGFVFMLSAWLIAKVFENEFLCSKEDVDAAQPGGPCYGAEPLKDRSLLLPN